MLVDVAMIRGIAKGSVAEGSDKLKEERSCAVPEEGFWGQFGLILQSLMQFQTAYNRGPDCTQKDDVSLVENLSSTLPEPSEEVLLKSTAMVVKVPISSIGPRDAGNAAVHGVRKVLQGAVSPEDQNVLPLDQLYFVPEMVDGSGDMHDQEVSGPLYLAIDFTASKAFDGADAEEQILNAASHTITATPAEDGQLDSKGMLTSGTSSYNGWRYIAEEMADIQSGIDDDAKSGGLASSESMALRDQSASASLDRRMGNINAGSSIIMGVETVDEGMYDADSVDDAQEGLNLDLGGSHESHTLERLYAAGQPQPIHSDETSPVFGEKPLELHQALAEIADKVRVLLSEKRSEMEVRLKPPELGRMVVKVAMENGALAVRITVESDAVKDFIQAHAQELKMLLAQEGYTLADIDVDIGQGYQQPQRDEWGSDWRFENPVSRRSRAGVSGIQQSIIRSGAYYHGQHSFDCLV